MSLQLNNELVSALNRLKDNPSFQQLMNAFADVIHDEMHRALDQTEPPLVLAAQQRVRALRDVWHGFYVGAKNVKGAQVPRQEINKGKPLRSGLPTKTFAGENGETPPPNSVVINTGEELLG